MADGTAAGPKNGLPANAGLVGVGDGTSSGGASRSEESTTDLS
ncbi:hypothetical protein [Saliphagus infecundisoli]|uniref:Uncharacterized protein n=1 Tax=Saliphagus infecundisoli TaxID=1849069 RepID=A0ABD5QFA7_9EURY|nr:hypothetical protein [Saliphagus infecundisoli]